MRDAEGVDPEISKIYSEKDSIYYSKADSENEEKVMKFLEKSWDCNFHRFPRLHHIDFFTSRDGRLQSYVELKCKHHNIHTYEYAWISVHQWESLVRHETMFGVPGIFVIAFSDNNICWIKASSIDRNSNVFLTYKNTKRNLKRNCREYGDRWKFTPALEVPILAMTLIDASEDGGLNLKF